MEICDRCGAGIDRGETRYIVKVMVSVDDGGEIEAPISNHEIEEIIEQMQKIDPAQLERSVYEKRTYILCPSCREQFIRNPLGKSPYDPPEPDEGEYLH